MNIPTHGLIRGTIRCRCIAIRRFSSQGQNLKMRILEYIMVLARILAYEPWNLSESSASQLTNYTFL
jgi:hypothetical protein